MTNTQKLIKELVEDYYKIEITKNVRKRVYVEARAIYYKLLRDNTRCSLEEIGKTMNRDHSTVLHFLKQINNWIEYDKDLRRDYEILKERLLTAAQLNPKGFKLSDNLENFWEVEYKNLNEKYEKILFEYNCLSNRLNEYTIIVEENKQLRIQNGYLKSKGNIVV